MTWIRQNLLLLAVVTGLLLWPLLTIEVPAPAADGNGVPQFAGTDNQAVVAVRELAPDYQPWFSPLLGSPDAAVESLLFALQAVLGLGVIAWYFGVKRRQARAGQKDARRAD